MEKISSKISIRLVCQNVFGTHYFRLSLNHLQLKFPDIQKAGKMLCLQWELVEHEQIKHVLATEVNRTCKLNNCRDSLSS